MKLFTVGPVEMYPETLLIEGSQQPYFRTPEFASVMKEIENDFMQSIYVQEKMHFIALTCSGTGAMEAAVVNALNKKDKVLIINGGGFGARFVQLCKIYQIPYEEYELPIDAEFCKEAFQAYDNKGFTALLVNACETTTGQLYDLDFLGQFCSRNNMIFIVDAISAYLADSIHMHRQNIDVLITASQKALALAPGVSLIALSDRVYKERVSKSNGTLYFNLNLYIENQKRGQPPFTSAVGTMLALHQRLRHIAKTGVETEIAIHKSRADYFRMQLNSLPIEIPKYRLSNCCTPIIFPLKNALTIYKRLKEQHEIILTPSGGSKEQLLLRVGHLGNLQVADYDYLLEKLSEALAQ